MGNKVEGNFGGCSMMNDADAWLMSVGFTRNSSEEHELERIKREIT
jgi:hypothetical protein